jgi:hypothetical protein
MYDKSVTDVISPQPELGRVTRTAPTNATAFPTTDTVGSPRTDSGRPASRGLLVPEMSSSLASVAVLARGGWSVVRGSHRINALQRLRELQAS